MEDKNIVKELFSAIVNIISNDYNIIFDGERMLLSITSAADWDIEILNIEVANGTIRVYWNEDDYTFRNTNDANRFIRERLLINEFMIMVDNINVSEVNYQTIIETLKQFED